MSEHASVTKGVLGFITAGAGLAVSTLESLKLHLQVLTLCLSTVIAILTIISLVRGLKRPHKPNQRESDAP